MDYNAKGFIPFLVSDSASVRKKTVGERPVVFHSARNAVHGVQTLNRIMRLGGDGHPTKDAPVVVLLIPNSSLTPELS